MEDKNTAEAAKLEKFKELLTDGTITQQQYNMLLQTGSAQDETQPEQELQQDKETQALQSSRPFLIAAAVFGMLGLVMLVLTVASFFIGGGEVAAWLSSVLHVDSGKLKDDTFAQVAVVLFIPAFIFAYRAFCDAQEG